MIIKNNVWDISYENALYIYNNLHMNNYIFAALTIFHKTNPPLGKIISLKKEKIPDFLISPIEKFIELSPYIGNSDPTIVRTNYNYLSFQLFKSFKNLKLQDLDQVIPLLSCLAYISILADKNDNLLLWKRSVIRKLDDYLISVYNMIQDNIDIIKFDKNAIFKNEKWNPNKESYYYASLFTTRAVASIIAMIENNIDKNETAEKFQLVEKNLLVYESEYNISFKKNNLSFFFQNQIGYKNTLYLYGGNHFERMGHIEKAFSWYIKDIYFINLPKYFKFYLTSMKTTERLLCAYRVSPKRKDKILLKDLIKHCVLEALKKSSIYSNKILDYVENNQKLDLIQEKFPLNKNDFLLWGGESSREIFLLALLYNKIINNIDYADIEYHDFFIF